MPEKLSSAQADLESIVQKLTIQFPGLDVSEKTTELHPSIKEWQKILHGRLMAACNATLAVVDPVIEEKLRREQAAEAAADMYEKQQVRIESHELKEPLLEKGQKRIGRTREESWKTEHAEWEGMREKLVGELIGRHAALFEAAAKRKEFNPFDIVDAEMLFQTEDALDAEIERVASLAEKVRAATDPAKKTSEWIASLRELAKGDKELEDAFARVAGNLHETEKPEAKPKGKTKPDEIIPGKNPVDAVLDNAKSALRSGDLVRGAPVGKQRNVTDRNEYIRIGAKMRKEPSFEKKEEIAKPDEKIEFIIPGTLDNGTTTKTYVIHLNDAALAKVEVPDLELGTERLENEMTFMAKLKKSADKANRRIYFEETSSGEIAFKMLVEKLKERSKGKNWGKMCTQVILAIEEAQIHPNSQIMACTIRQLFIHALLPHLEPKMHETVLRDRNSVVSSYHLSMKVKDLVQQPYGQDFLESIVPKLQEAQNGNGAEERFYKGLQRLLSYVRLEPEEQKSSLDAAFALFKQNTDASLRNYSIVATTRGAPIVAPSFWLMIVKMREEVQRERSLAGKAAYEWLTKHLAKIALEKINGPSTVEPASPNTNFSIVLGSDTEGTSLETWSIPFTSDALEDQEIPDEAAIETQLAAERHDLVRMKKSLDTDPKNFCMAVSLAEKMIKGIDEACTKETGVINKRKSFALAAHRLRTAETGGMKAAECNILRQLFLLSLKEDSSRYQETLGNPYEAIAEFELPLSFGLVTEPATTEKILTARPQLANFAMMSRCQNEFRQFLRRSASLLTDVPSEIDGFADRYVSMYFQELAAITKRIQNDVLAAAGKEAKVIVPSMYYFLKTLEAGMENETSLVCRAQRERIMNDIAFWCLEMTDALPQ